VTVSAIAAGWIRRSRVRQGWQDDGDRGSGMPIFAIFWDMLIRGYMHNHSNGTYIVTIIAKII
jgi:hypothetical protein